MTDTAQKSSSSALFGPDLDGTADRVRALNEQLLSSTKQAGNAWLDVYENTVTHLVDLQTKLADASGLDWASDLAKAQASFLSEVTTSVTNAARTALK